METANIAASFVDLVLKHERWDQISELPADEVEVFLSTVTAAGLDPESVVPGKLRGNYREQDGSSTGDTYPINGLCPFKVVSQAGGDHYLATGWLDCALRRVVKRQNEDRDRLIEAIALEIERSVPLTPVPLTPEGDLLQEYPPSIHGFGLQYFVEHTRNENKLGSCVGVHAHCNCWMDRCGATGTHDAIVCRGCHLRVLFPREVETYGELRQALTPKGVEASA